jgi:hypothetical protein
VRLALGQLERDREAAGVDERVDFGRKPAAGTAHATASTTFFRRWPQRLPPLIELLRLCPDVSFFREWRRHRMAAFSGKPAKLPITPLEKDDAFGRLA